jgi:hypothetical protein
MGKKIADSGIVKLIYKLADDPSKVRTTKTAKRDMFALGLTIRGICEAIQEWIDDKKPIEEDVTKHVSEHLGKPIYIMKPHIESHSVLVYVKVQIDKDVQTGKYLLIISSHQ